MSSQKRQPVADHGTADYWKQVLAALPRGYSKPSVAVEAALKMNVAEVPVPQVLQGILEKAVELANQ